MVMNESQTGYLSPDEISGESFETKRRGGIDPDAVKRHLASAAATVRGLTAERASLQDQVASLQAELAAVVATEAPIESLDEDAITERLGQDAGRVLAEARSAAADRIAEAKNEADDIRAAAEEVFAERSVLADQEAQRIREAAAGFLTERKEDAEREAEEIIAAAHIDADTSRSDVSSERQSADAEAVQIIREAELTRRQILEDLARRRSAARRQIEQLRAGRERLLASHETVRRALDDISEELSISMSEARAAAETAGHTVSETTIEELEAEIETARLTGLLDTGPLPIVGTVAGTKVTSKAIPTSKIVQAAAAPKPVVSPKEGVASALDDTSIAGKADAEEDLGTAGDAAEDDASTSDETTESAASPAGLAEVVQFDRARGDVDTATHPAKGRDATNGRSGAARPATTEAASPTETKPAARNVTKLESVKMSEEALAAPPDDTEPEESVEDLFATLRSSSTPAKAPQKNASEKKATKKKAAKKKPTEISSDKNEAVTTPPEDEVDSSEMARRLKRVLADEQSRAMSTLKTADQMPALDGLLGADGAHFESYWVEVVGQFDVAVLDRDEVRVPIEDLVATIRRRVDDAIQPAGDDTDAVLNALRSVYREVKTRQIGTCAAAVCSAAAAQPSL
ncbi:MAG: ElaB/YqjD/DUF883 family membrane-anchored ribosome-binding protein [Verrucomicrobiales bacterium]